MSILIGGVESFTTVDFPHRLAAVLFCRGCPLRCPYCHNPELQMFTGKDYISWETFIEFLKTRQKLLDGVVFSGGEPLAQAELRSAMEQVKSMGFEVGLHTSGVNPQRLAEVLPLITWVGFDVKTDFDNYGRIPLANGKTAEKCLDLCLESGVELECRTTLDPRVIKKDELLPMAEKLAAKGVKTYAMQEFRPHPNDKTAPALEQRTAFFTDKKMLERLRGLFDEVIVRRA